LVKGWHITPPIEIIICKNRSFKKLQADFGRNSPTDFLTITLMRLIVNTFLLFCVAFYIFVNVDTPTLTPIVRFALLHFINQKLQIKLLILFYK